MRKLLLFLNITIITIIVAGCGNPQGDQRKTIDLEDTGSSITIIEDIEDEADNPEISIDRIDAYHKIEISDWLDHENLIVSRENESLDKLSLAELSDNHPRSLYQFSLESGEYRLLVEDGEQNLSGGKLSPDKKHMIYQGYTLGDPSFYILNLENLESVNIKGETVGNVGGAKWVNNSSLIGPGYMGGAYISGVDGKGYDIKELADEAIYIVEKIDDTIYYTSAYDATLMFVNLSTQEKLNLGLSDVIRMIPSPDGKQMLVIQSDGAKQTLILSDIDGNKSEIVAAGTDIGGLSWSPDQRMFAYSIKGDGATSAKASLYIFDMLTSKPIQIAVDVENVTTCFSPSSEALAFSMWDGSEYNSSVVYFNMD